MIRVMIAEDEKIEREALRMLIETYYGEDIQLVYEASTGKELLQQARKFKPQIVLMDIQMPQLDGLEAAEQLKQMDPDIEIVFLTAFSYFEYAQKAITIGALDYLVKPFSNQKFFSVMDTVIGKIREKQHFYKEQNFLHEQLNRLKRMLDMHGITSEVPEKNHEDQIVVLVKRYMEKNLAEDISLEKVAKEIGMSPYYLSRYFKKEDGTNFKDYMIKIRMDRAKFLLCNHRLNVQETALQVGYSDPNYFSRAFKKHTGLSPTEYTELYFD